MTKRNTETGWGIITVGAVAAAIVRAFKDDPMTLVWIALGLIVIIGGGWWIAGRLKKNPMWAATYVVLVDKGRNMLGAVKVFIALVCLIGGGILLMAFGTEKMYYLGEHLTEAILGIVLFASGATFFWTQTPFYKK
jgi:hypothetical protein